MSGKHEKGFNLGQLESQKQQGETDRGAQVRQSLNISNPSQGNPHAEYRHDRLTLLQLSEIDEYDNNPRRKRNTEDWNELKESIRVRGVENAIKVTQRPGSGRYFVAAGGNSRLGVMRELWQETSDDRLAAIPVQYVAFKSELEMFVQHIIENEQRYEMSFWDKATAMSILAEKSDAKGLSNRDLSIKFAEKGGKCQYSCRI